MPIKDRYSGKLSSSGNNRSKALNITKRPWEFNLQSFRVIMPNGITKRIKTSVKNYKALIKQGRVSSIKEKSISSS